MLLVCNTPRLALRSYVVATSRVAFTSSFTARSFSRVAPPPQRVTSSSIAAHLRRSTTSTWQCSRDARRKLHTSCTVRQEVEKLKEKAKETAAAGVEAVEAATQPTGKDPIETMNAAARQKPALSEDIWTLPNVLTMARLASTPYLGYLILNDQMKAACILLFVAGSSDALDGWIARRRASFTVFGSIADPAADKALMTVMVVALGWRGLLPLPLAALIIGRDVLLVISAFFVRYRTLPAPKTLKRYFDPSLPSAQVKPTQISKINTLLQLILVGGTTLLPVLPAYVQSAAATPWSVYMGVVAMTTIWSGLGYLRGGGSTNLASKISAKLKNSDPTIHKKGPTS